MTNFMPSKKLLSRLQLFSRQELSRFDQYLASPYFNENEDLKLLYRLVMPYLSSKGAKTTDNLSIKKLIWLKLYGRDCSYNDGQMRRLLSELTQHAHRFLALKKFEENPIQEQVSLLEALKEDAQDSHFTSLLRQTHSKELSVNFYSWEIYFQKHKIADIQHYRSERAGDINGIFNNLKNADYHLDCYYFIKKLKYYCDVLDHRSITDKPVEIHLPFQFLEWLPESVFFQETKIKIYFSVIQMFLNAEKTEYFYQVKEMLSEAGQEFVKEELNHLYIYLKNYCIDSKINKGNLSFFNELFDVFKNIITQNIILKDGVLHPQDYKNIISVSIQVREFAWTEAFIQNYTPKLPPEERENALTYNLAKVYFAQNQYEKVIEQLREVEYDNLTYALGGKLMLLKTYYELNEYLALDSLIDSFRVYLRRNQTISKEVRQQYLNVLRFIKKLSNIHSGDQVAIAKIEQQIQECKNLADKGWIVQKVESLKG